ncbi:TPA: translation initiation factor IF-3 [Candidatus Berkelbacteria bacterium]|nr:translation initiation factor IF-3 [Candidatus Berkelbacteria bacterium]
MKDLKINEEIKTDPIVLIDEDGGSHGQVSLDQARYLAYEKGLDLALINDKVSPPVVKMMDYGKYIYNQTKMQNKQKAKAHGSELKEVRFGIKIDTHDLEVKINKIKQFLDKGDKVKVTIQLRGREMMFRDRMADLMEKIKTETGGVFDKPVEKMGNRFFATMSKGK